MKKGGVIVACQIALVVCFALASVHVEASLIVPNVLAYDVDSICVEGTAAVCSISRHSNDPARNSQRYGQSPTGDDGLLLLLLSKQALLMAEGSGMTGAQGPSSSGSGSGGMAPLGDPITACSPDVSLLGWLQGEVRLALPDPPGTDLLRPPRV